VKYADLSTSRTKDYVFDLARMVSLQGNTAVYLQYAHARVRSVLAKLPAGAADAQVDVTLPLHPAERALALRLDEFERVLAEVARTLEPHRLCAYLFEVAQAFSDFYESCPIVNAHGDAQRANRVALARLTGATLAAASTCSASRPRLACDRGRGRRPSRTRAHAGTPPHTGAHLRSGERCPDAACRAEAAARSPLLRAVPCPVEATSRNAAATQTMRRVDRACRIDP
jgi:hypothetical protein